MKCTAVIKQSVPVDESPLGLQRLAPWVGPSAAYAIGSVFLLERVGALVVGKPSVYTLWMPFIFLLIFWYIVLLVFSQIEPFCIWASGVAVGAVCLLFSFWNWGARSIEDLLGPLVHPLVWLRDGLLWSVEVLRPRPLVKLWHDFRDAHRHHARIVQSEVVDNRGGELIHEIMGHDRVDAPPDEIDPLLLIEIIKDVGSGDTESFNWGKTQLLARTYPGWLVLTGGLWHRLQDGVITLGEWSGAVSPCYSHALSVDRFVEWVVTPSAWTQTFDPCYCPGPATWWVGVSTFLAACLLLVFLSSFGRFKRQEVERFLSKVRP